MNEKGDGGDRDDGESEKALDVEGVQGRSSVSLSGVAFYSMETRIEYNVAR